MLNFNKFNKLNESAPKIPKKVKYWVNKGKVGKNVMIYFHDDLDGIYSAIAVKNYLEQNEFEIEGYGIVNYQEGWSRIKLNDKYINIALDYAENVEGIDIYIDHHGSFTENDEQVENPAIKTKTGSAYEGIMDQLGLPVDSMILDTIDMVDSAKYDEYDIDIKGILEFDISKKKNKLDFAAAFNQLLKRSDHKTFIEVVANTKDINPSVYNIYRLFRLLYPANNLNNIELKKLAKLFNFLDDKNKPDVAAFIDYIKSSNEVSIKNFEKDFLNDAFYRLAEMTKRTEGGIKKDYIKDQDDFKNRFQNNDKVSMDGYQILGNLVFIPSGTWSNALRARAIIEKALLDDDRIPIINYIISKNSPLYDDLINKSGMVLELVGDIRGELFTPINNVTNDGNIEGIKGIIDVNNGEMIFRAKQPIMFMMLQYGNTLQVATLHKYDKYVDNYLPKMKNGEPIKNLGKYTENLLKDMVIDLGYNIKAVEKATTKAGGHEGIGSVSNIFGNVNMYKTAVPDPDNTSKTLKLSDNALDLMERYHDVRFLDIFRNKMINDLSGIPFNDLTMKWGDPDEKLLGEPKPDEINKKVMMKDEIRKAQDVIKQNEIDAKKTPIENVKIAENKIKRFDDFLND